MTDETERVVEAPGGVEIPIEKGEASAPRPRRRRRGGRGRGRSRSAGSAAPLDTGISVDGAESGTMIEAAPIPSSDGLVKAPGAGEGETKPATRRRRRRGGRGRGGKRPAPTAGQAAEARAPEPPAPDTEAVALGPREETGERAEEATARKPGRRRRRRPASAGAGKTPEEGETAEPSPTAEEGAAAEAPAKPRRRSRAKPKPEEEPAAEEPSEPKRRGRKKAEAPEAAAAPTRVRRARQTTGRRRREPLVVVPRVTDKVMVITEHGERDQIAILEGRDLVQHYVTRAGAKSMVGNVYLGRVQNVLPGMEAAFVDVGRGRNAVLYAGEVNYTPEDLEGGAPPRIEHVLKSGQSVLVQVTKDPIGGKGARLTAQVSMPGRYLVLVPDSSITGISRRLPDTERRRLKAILKKIRPEGHGLIIRTAAEGTSEEAMAQDLVRVLAEWESIAKGAKKAKAPALLYEEPELTVRAVRDLFNDEEFRELVTDSSRIYGLVTQYLGQVAPDLLAKVRLHQSKLPVFEEFHVVEQIHKGLDRKVWLASGGYIVIDRTEALTVIDVNTGKSVGRTNLEETVVNTNLEAAREVARQLRLRDIGGMIIIDFIDMLLDQNKKKVVDTLKEAMAQDKTRSQVFDIGPLGLLEVTRKRVSGGLLESFSETCPTCEGRGVLLTYEA
jgi:ribonuclease E